MVRRTAFWSVILLFIGISSCKPQIGFKNNNHNQSNNNGNSITSADTLMYHNLSPFGFDYNTVTPEETKGYKLMIIEPGEFDYDSSKIEALKVYGTKIFGYVSLGEVDPSRPYFNQVKKLGENADWGSYFIDLSDSTTYNLFIKQIIPEIANAKVDGLFFDTVDDYAPYTSYNDLAPYMVKLIKQIHAVYPNLMLIMNGGWYLLDSLATDINADLIEDIATDYDFNTKTYQLRDKSSFLKQIQDIYNYSQQYNLPFLIVDYAVDDSLIKLVEARLNKYPYPYFITNIGGNHLNSGVIGNNY